LRWRLVAALVVTTAFSLGVAAFVLLSPLQHRLRDEESRSLLADAVAAQADFKAVGGASGARGIAGLVRSLRRRQGGRLFVVDARGQRVADTNPDSDAPTSLAGLRAALNGGLTRTAAASRARVTVPVSVGGRRYMLVWQRRIGDIPLVVGVVRDAFLKAALIALAFALVLGVVVSNRLLQRLAALRSAARQIASEGLDAQVAVQPGRDEVGEVAGAFAAMQARLREQENARRAFVATASHELRTPLTSLQLTLELLEQTLPADRPELADARAQVALAQAQSGMLNELADDLLDLSRLDANAPLRHEPVELGEICRAVAAEFRSRASKRHLTLDVQTDGPCWAMGDPASVARIVRLLLDNALRVSPPHSTVELVPSGVPGTRTIEVGDEGPGVPANERELIFGRFKRGSTTCGAGGFGLGLAIGRELARRMGGDLQLSETASGARFALQLTPSINGATDD
jgi:signal transduction histidine kinase